MNDNNILHSNILHDFIAFTQTAAASPAPANPFPLSERTRQHIIQRITKARVDFWYFDKTYFTKELYNNYAPPNKMLKEIVKSAAQPGYHIFFGARKHGKTITAKKLLIFLLITGKISLAAVYSETLLKSSGILKDITSLILNNDRILHDFNINFNVANTDQIAFTVNTPLWSANASANAFSEGRSLRGFTKLFGRPQIIIADDIETLESSFSQDAVKLRIDKLIESKTSCEDNAPFIILANNFTRQGALFQIQQQHNAGILSDNWHVNTFPAFANKPLWHQRWNVPSEHQLKDILKPKDEADWQANYQQNPIPPDGFYFTREHYREYDTIPKDAKGIIYCDPNLAKKAKGDTTAVTVLLYSPKIGAYFVADALCKSFADSNILLNEILRLKSNNPAAFAIAFDGAVSQESSWSQHIRNHCLITKTPFPPVHFKNYHIDNLAKNTQLVFSQNKILFPKNFASTNDGKQYLTQLFAFTGKKSAKRDDAPDSLIAAFEFIHEQKLTRHHNQIPTPIPDFYTPF